MPATDPRVDAYIDHAAPFAQPILRELRQRVHAACPAVEESLRWSAPAFLHCGKLMCIMAAFKQHAAFVFWRGTQPGQREKRGAAMGQLGRLTRLSDLPGKREMGAELRQAMRLIETGARPARAEKPPRAALPLPDDLRAALARQPQAQAAFAGFAPSHRRDYIEWIVEAKRADTRARRIAQAIEWIAAGKHRHWKYERA